MDRTPPWPPPVDADPERVAKWARGRMTVAGVPRPDSVRAELLPTSGWRLRLTFATPGKGVVESARAAVSPVPAEVTTIEFHG